MMWTAGGGHCQTRVSTDPGRRSSDDGVLAKGPTTMNTTHVCMQMGPGWTTRLRLPFGPSASMLEVRFKLETFI